MIHTHSGQTRLDPDRAHYRSQSQVLALAVSSHQPCTKDCARPAAQNHVNRRRYPLKHRNYLLVLPSYCKLEAKNLDHTGG